MKIKICNVIVLLSVSISIFSCTDKKEQIISEINQLESQLTGNIDDMIDSAAVSKITGLYLEYAKQFPDDTSSAGYLFKAGDISSKSGNIEQAISIFEQLIVKYPDNRNAPYALFLQGFIYENQVGDPAKAKPYYEKFLESYPDHPIAGDVTFSLENLGKSPEDLIREFEQNQTSDSLQLEMKEPA